MPDHTDEHDEFDLMEDCIQNCTECHMVCEETMAYCLQMGGEHAGEAHIRTLLDCAQVCTISANFMLHDSDLHPQMCGVCAQACERCAQSCEQFNDDQQMLDCAEICRQCAESCHKMATTQHMAM